MSIDDFSRAVSRELADFLREEEEVERRRRMFLQSEEVREHLRKHGDSATLVFGSAEKKEGGLESVADDSDFTHRRQDDRRKFWSGYAANMQESRNVAKGAGYSSDGAGGVSYGAQAGEENVALYSQGARDKAFCNASDCGCSFSLNRDGSVSRDFEIPGMEGGKGYNPSGSNASGGYNAAKGSDAYHSGLAGASSKVSYGR